MRIIALTIAITATACATRPASAPCSLPERDQRWLIRSLDAWRFATKEIADIDRVPPVDAIFFSADCVVSSANALTSPKSKGVKWTASPHGPTVTLPDGSEIPAGVTSFAAGKKGQTYFVMSTPTVWEAAHVGEGPKLETTMVGVLLHEASHIAQTGPYGPRLGRLIDQNHLPDSFNDDAVQDRFRENAEFAASVKRETQLFIEAATTKDDAQAKALARDARKLMLDRKARWFVGGDAYFAEAEDIWLTFEGAGQWIAYRWLVDPRGAAQPAAELIDRFTKGRWWSQTEGFAVVMALDRFAGSRWKQQAYGAGERTVLEMLDDALAAN